VLLPLIVPDQPEARIRASPLWCPRAVLLRAVDFAWAHPAERGQEGPLIIIWFHRGQIEEHGYPIPSGFAVQRRGDQISYRPA
jgi:hypothetical protein